MAQPEHKKEMDLYGNWEIVAGRMFRYDDASYIGYQEAMARIRDWKPDIYISIDWGYKPSYHSAGWYAVFPDHTVIRFKGIYGQELIFEDFVKKIRDISKPYYITATCLPHDLYRRGDKYKDDEGKTIGEMKSDVFDHYGLNPVGVTSGKGTVLDRYDRIHSAASLENEKGEKKFRIVHGNGNEDLKYELDNAVYDDNGTGYIAKGQLDHAIDDFGLFLTMYSEDIAPITLSDIEPEDTREKWQARLEDEIDALAAGEAVYDEDTGEVSYYVADDFDLC